MVSRIDIAPVSGSDDIKQLLWSRHFSTSARNAGLFMI
jgi:hypothetical protein